MKDKTVAHFNYSFFVRSETFVYRFVSGLRTFKPVLFANQYENLDRFPFPESDRYFIRAPKYSLTWLLNGMTKKLSGRDPRVSRILKERSASLIHAHFGTTGYECLPFKRSAGIPLVTTFYGADASSVAQQPVWKRRYAELFAEGDVFLVEGECMKSKLTALGCPEEKVLIQRIGIDVSGIEFQKRKPKPRDQKTVFIFCGRFVEKKGLLLVLEALKRLDPASRDRLVFKIIGDGPLKATIEEKIASYGLAGQVELLGFLNYERYLHEMKSADIFIHPSVTGADGDSEGGAPTTILEAQAMGLPVLASDHADIPNITLPGESALLAREGNVEDIAGLMRRMMDHSDLWPRMSESGRAFVERRHDIEKEISNLEEIYSLAVSGRISEGAACV